MKKIYLAVLTAVFLPPAALFADANDPNLNQDSNNVSNIIKAAQQGDAPSQFTLGLFYEIGIGVPQDYNQAVKWYTKAAESARFLIKKMQALNEKDRAICLSILVKG